MQHIFIINPTAGKVDASVALIPQIHAAASRAGLHPTIEVTRRAGQARDLAAQYAASEDETIDDYGGWWSYTRITVTQERLVGWSAPTHWMPLPALPNEATND